MYDIKFNKHSLSNTYKYNTVRNLNTNQGVIHISDLSQQILRDINTRSIGIQNSSIIPIGISITNYFEDKYPPKIMFTMGPRESKHLSINSQGSTDQFIHIFDINTNKYLGPPSIIDRYSNEFVLRQGLNKWFITPYRFPSYRASF